jgi:hypothetical protein
MEDEQQIQKTIASLRFKTQEALAKSQEEISQLEEEKELREMKLEELDKEIQELENENNFGLMASLKDVQAPLRPRGRARRRWSMNAANTWGDEDYSDHHKRSKSAEDDMDFIDDKDIRNNRRFSLIGFKKRNSSMRFLGKSDGDTKKVNQEAEMMKKLHEVQEENKKVIEQHESNLAFKKEQVQALQLALEEQGKIISQLEDEIYRWKENEEDGDKRNDTAELQEKLSEYMERENQLSNNIRAIRRILYMDDADRKTAINILTKEIVEASVRLKSVRGLFEQNKRILEEDVRACQVQWALLGVKVSLMERVSQKQLRRLQKKARKGASDDLQEILERATRALEEELEMRESDTETHQMRLREAGYMQELVHVMLSCCKSYTDGVAQFKSKEFCVNVRDTIVSTLRQMSQSVELTQKILSSTLYLMEEAVESYDLDEALVPNDIRTAYSHVSAYLEDDESSNPPSEDEEELNEVDNGKEFQLDVLNDRYEELDRQIKEAKQRLEDFREEAGKQRREWKSKIRKLKQKYEEGGKEWDEKNVKVEQAFAEAEEAKLSEDRLRDFLERVAASRTQTASNVEFEDSAEESPEAPMDTT